MLNGQNKCFICETLGSQKKKRGLTLFMQTTRRSGGGNENHISLKFCKDVAESVKSGSKWIGFCNSFHSSPVTCAEFPFSVFIYDHESV